MWLGWKDPNKQLAEHILNNPPYYSERSKEWARRVLEVSK
jgi:tRNA1(Val) A37 N6-methylase TrmN6